MFVHNVQSPHWLDSPFHGLQICLSAVRNQWLQAMCFLWPSWELYPLLIRSRSWWRMVCSFCNTFALHFVTSVASDKVPSPVLPVLSPHQTDWLSGSLKDLNPKPFPKKSSDSWSDSWYTCHQFTLRKISNLMIAFWIHIQQLSAFLMLHTLWVSPRNFIFSLQDYSLMRANPEDFASGVSCLVRYLCL